MHTAKTILYILEVLCCLGVITTIVLQSGHASGLSGAIAGGAQSLLGKKKGVDEFLNKLSLFLTIAFLLVTIILAMPWAA